MQLVTGCHNIAGRSRTCSEYTGDFLLALNAFGCLLQCAQRLRLLPTLAQHARLLRLPIASAPPCRRRLSVASIVCASLSKTTVLRYYRRYDAPPCRRRLFLDSPHCLCALVVDLAFQTLLRLLDLNRSLLRIRAQRGVDPPAPLLYVGAANCEL